MLSKYGGRKELGSSDLILSQTRRDSEISRAQGNSSCHQVALATVEKTQGIGEALSITWALFRTQRERKNSFLVGQIEVACPLASPEPYGAPQPI